MAFALAACSGGGDSDTRADRADAAVAGLKQQIADLTAERDRLETDLGTANGTVMTLTAEIGDTSDMADASATASLHAQLNAATADAAGLRMYIGMAADPASNADDASLYAQIAYHSGEVARLEGIAGNADDPAAADGSLNAQIAYHTGEASRIQGLLDTAGMDLRTANGTITGLRMMIGEADDEASDADGASLHAQLNHYKAEAAKLEQSIQDTADLVQVNKAKSVNTAIRASAGVAPGVDSVTASPDGDVMATATGYEDAGAAPNSGSLPTGLRGRMLEDPNDNQLVVYTDIEDATPTALGVLYDSSASGGDPTAYHAGRDADAGRSIPWASVKRSDKTTSTTTVDGKSSTTFKGSILMVAGTFSCPLPAAECVAPTYDDAGMLIENPTPARAGTWSFRPDDPNALAAVSDTAYMSLGWWLGKNDAGATVFNRFVTAHGSLATAYDNAVTGENVTGSASYTGAAAGKYSFLDEVLNSASAGHWTAAAKLVANFDADSSNEDTEVPEVNDKLGITLSGTIYDFVTGDGAQTWKVALNGVDANTEHDGMQGHTSFEALATAMAGATAKWTLSPDAAASGSGLWSADFHGAVRGMGDDNTVFNHPAAVSGMFSSSIGTRAHITGAYGAQRDKK